jgi:hypothetical protein
VSNGSYVFIKTRAGVPTLWRDPVALALEIVEPNRCNGEPHWRGNPLSLT